MHCRTASGRGAVHCGGEHRLASVYLLTASLFLPSQALLPSLPRFPRSFFHSRLCLLPFLPVGYVRVPDSLPSSLLPSFSLSLLHIPSVSRSFFFSFLSPRFFSPARRRDPRLVPHRPAERKDCKPADEPRIPEWGLLHSPFPLLSRASSSLGWMEHARREHRQLVGRGWGYVSSSLPSAF